MTHCRIWYLQQSGHLLYMTIGAFFSHGIQGSKFYKTDHASFSRWIWLDYNNMTRPSLSPAHFQPPFYHKVHKMTAGSRLGTDWLYTPQLVHLWGFITACIHPQHASYVHSIKYRDITRAEHNLLEQLVATLLTLQSSSVAASGKQEIRLSPYACTLQSTLPP